MRLIAIDSTPDRIRALYRWLDEPFTPSRLLADLPAATPDDLRRHLERAVFGEIMQPDRYQLVTAGDPAAIQAAFPGFVVIVHEGVPFDDLPFAVARPTFDELHALIAEHFIPYAPDPESARDAWESVRILKQVLVTGYSRRAVAAACAALAPDFEGRYVSLDDPVLSLPFEQLILVALSRDPGISRDEARLIESLSVDEHFPTAVLQPVFGDSLNGLPYIVNSFLAYAIPERLTELLGAISPELRPLLTTLAKIQHYSLTDDTIFNKNT